MTGQQLLPPSPPRLASRLLARSTPLSSYLNDLNSSSPHSPFACPDLCTTGDPTPPLPIDNCLFAEDGLLAPLPTPDNSFVDDDSSLLDEDNTTTALQSPQISPTHPPISLLTMTTFNMPLSNSRDAPRFSPDPSGFDSFFKDVSELATQAALNNADTIKWARRYAGSEGESWEHVTCLAAARQAQNPATFAQFKDEVRQIYPALSDNRRYTNRNLESLLERTRDYHNMSREDLGDYHRRFITCTAYLIHQNHFSDRERNTSYL